MLTTCCERNRVSSVLFGFVASVAPLRHAFPLRAVHDCLWHRLTQFDWLSFAPSYVRPRPFFKITQTCTSSEAAGTATTKRVPQQHNEACEDRDQKVSDLGSLDFSAVKCATNDRYPIHQVHVLTETQGSSVPAVAGSVSEMDVSNSMDV